MILFFDTETDGLPKNYKAPLTKLDNWPRLVELAWIVTNDAGEELDWAEFIVKPEGFTIPEAASKVHGITQAIAMEKGAPLTGVLEQFVKAAQPVLSFVAHNIAFDQKIVDAELLRNKLAPVVMPKLKRCTMELSTEFCRLVGPYGPKWPKLQELYKKLFDEEFEGAHSALADIRACKRCYFELIERKVIPPTPGTSVVT